MLRLAGMKPGFFWAPTLFSFIAALFEGASIALLLPIVQGVFNHSLSSINSVPHLRQLLGVLPASWISTDQRMLTILLVLFVIAIVLKNFLRYLSIVSMSFLAFRTAHHLRKQIFTHYLSFGKLFFDRSTIGHHATVLSNFTELAMNPVIGLDRYITQFFSVVTYLILMFTISWRLTLYAIPLFIFLHVSVTSLITAIRNVSNRITEISKSLQKKTLDILSTIPLVIAYNTQHLEKQRYTDISDDLSRYWFRAARLNHAINPLNELETLIAMLCLFTLILFVLPTGSISSAAMIVYFYLVMNSAIKFSTLTNFRSLIAQSSGPVSEILSVFSSEGKFVVADGTDVFPGLQKEIEFRNLRFGYLGGRTVLRDISFTVEKGRMTAIVGPTGSGKTTLINLLMRYYDCDPGSLFLDGKDIRSFTLASTRSHLALVSQDTHLFNDTIRANVTYGIDEVGEDHLRRVLEQSALSAFVDKLPQGLETLIGDRGVQLSGGEKQRISIARALLKEADILLLDEATSSLDSETERQIQEAIDRVVLGRTAIIIAHRLSTIRHADNIVVIEDGRCVEQGKLADLLAQKGVFYRLWQTQVFRDDV